MTVVISSLDEWRSVRERLNREATDIGLVPTMGALHAGHLSLVERSLVDNAATVVSLLVNPTQFNDAADLDTYPRDIEADREFLANLGADYVLLPTSAMIYPDDYRFRVSENDFSTKLCGAHRPGHFDGVLTIVMRLLNLVGPRRAYFGEKDFQQLRLVRGMATAFFMDVEIVGCPIVRHEDGLAMSSRNALLSTEARERAARFPEVLRDAADAAEVRRELEALGFEVDYVEDMDGRRLGAVVIDGVRLIDNMQLGRSSD